MHSNDIDGAITEIIDLLGPQRHPDSARLEHDMLAWFDRQHLPELGSVRRNRMRSYEFGLGTGAAYPNANYPTMLWWSKFTMWYMMVDDTVAETAAARDLPGTSSTQANSGAPHTTPCHPRHSTCLPRWCCTNF